jgi:hypothetical protein
MLLLQLFPSLLLLNELSLKGLKFFCLIFLKLSDEGFASLALDRLALLQLTPPFGRNCISLFF